MQTVPWHQDNLYTHLLGRALNCFIALEQTPPNKGTLRVARGSLLRGVRPNRENQTFAKGHREAIEPPAEAEVVTMSTMFPGDACSFDCASACSVLASTRPTHHGLPTPRNL
eukprot:COSAG05_NODE_50_length_24118_cov_89.534036_8_plen_112_part_00